MFLILCRELPVADLYRSRNSPQTAQELMRKFILNAADCARQNFCSFAARRKDKHDALLRHEKAEYEVVRSHAGSSEGSHKRLERGPTDGTSQDYGVQG